jgi:hypothetical protein
MKHEIELDQDHDYFKECLFNIEVEHLNHISPSNYIIDQRTESPSDKYLAVLDARDRKLLGIKKYYKSYPKEKCVPKNSEINSDAVSIFFHFSENKKIYRYHWKISEERNEFFVVYLGITALSYCENIDWRSLERIVRLELLQNKFKQLVEERPEIFDSFISNFCGNKRIYFSASNSYDLQLPRAEFNMGITDSHFSESPESIHIVQNYWSRSGMWLPVSLDFKLNFIEFIMLTFTLAQIELTSDKFIPVLLDLMNFDLRRRSLERKKNLLSKISEVVVKGKCYLDAKRGKQLTYFDLLYPAQLVRSRSTKDALEKVEYAEFTHFFSKVIEDKRKIDDLITVINYSQSDRIKYEIERKREYEDVRELIESHIEALSNHTS